jgi:hypothetical protein
MKDADGKGKKTAKDRSVESTSKRSSPVHWGTFWPTVKASAGQTVFRGRLGTRFGVPARLSCEMSGGRRRAPAARIGGKAAGMARQFQAPLLVTNRPLLATYKIDYVKFAWG